jgi:hypothetical protein
LCFRLGQCIILRHIRSCFWPRVAFRNVRFLICGSAFLLLINFNVIYLLFTRNQSFKLKY